MSKKIKLNLGHTKRNSEAAIYVLLYANDSVTLWSRDKATIYDYWRNSIILRSVERTQYTKIETVSYIFSKIFSKVTSKLFFCHSEPEGKQRVSFYCNVYIIF